MADLCWTLLKALAHDYEDLRTELKGPKRDKNIEELVHRHLETSNKNVRNTFTHTSFCYSSVVLTDNGIHSAISTFFKLDSVTFDYVVMIFTSAHFIHACLDLVKQVLDKQVHQVTFKLRIEFSRFNA